MYIDIYPDIRSSIELQIARCSPVQECIMIQRQEAGVAHQQLKRLVAHQLKRADGSAGATKT